MKKSALLMQPLLPKMRGASNPQLVFDPIKKIFGRFPGEKLLR
jgi:hypothetical protein